MVNFIFDIFTNSSLSFFILDISICLHLPISFTDLNSFKSYIDSESLFSRINSEQYNEALKELTNQGEEDAINNGLLEKADENGKSLIETFVKSNKKYKDYNVEYEYI